MPKRRAAGEGTIYFNNGRQRWEGKFPYIDPETGKTCRKLFIGQTLKEVTQKGNVFLGNIKSGLLPSADKITLGEWIKVWLNEYIKPSVRVKTYEKYSDCLLTYIFPRLGNYPMKKIKAPDMQKIFNDMAATGCRGGNGLSVYTIRNTRTAVSMMYAKAVELGLAAKNITQGTKPPPHVRREVDPLTEEQANNLLTVAKSGNYIHQNFYDYHSDPGAEYLKQLYYNAVLLTLNSGLRLGEVFWLALGGYGRRGEHSKRKADACTNKDGGNFLSAA